MLLGAENAAITSLMDPDKLKSICDFTTAKIKEYAIGLIDSGAEVVCILEPSAIMLYPDQFEQFSISYVNEITKACKQHSDAGVILHICGNTMPIVKSMAASDVDAISIDSRQAGVKLEELVKIVTQVRENLVIIGNISPTDVMLYGTPEIVKREVETVLDIMSYYPYFILSTGCDLPPETPEANIHAFMEAGRGMG